MMRCEVCKIKFPEEMLAPMMTSDGNAGQVCGRCGLKLRNQAHDLPEDTLFSEGSQAELMYDAAMEWLKSKKNIFEFDEKDCKYD